MVRKDDSSHEREVLRRQTADCRARVDSVLDRGGDANFGDVTANDITANDIVVSGTVDGRDIAADGAVLDGIEPGADITDATNVNAAGAVMESDFTPAFSILAQQSGTGAPEILQVGVNTIIGRVTGGGSEIDDLTPSQVRNLLNVADGATASPYPNAASVTVAGVSEYATAAEAEAGTSDALSLTPASIAALMMLLPKAFGSFDPQASPTIKANHFNFGGTLTRNGTGDYTLTFDTALADADYTVTCTPTDTVGTAFSWGVIAQTTTTLRIFIRLPTGAASDAAENVHIVVHQNLAP